MHETIRSFKNYIKHMHILQHIFEKINCKIQDSLASLGAGFGINKRKPGFPGFL